MLRSNLTSGQSYTADTLDAAKALIPQEEIMRDLKTKYSNQILTFNYQNLTLNPHQVLTLLIEWLDLEWSTTYLHPETNNRAINTASVVQARSPINNNSLGDWKNYKELIEPIGKRLKNAAYLIYNSKQLQNILGFHSSIRASRAPQLLL